MKWRRYIYIVQILVAAIAVVDFDNELVKSQFDTFCAYACNINEKSFVLIPENRLLFFSTWNLYISNK